MVSLLLVLLLALSCIPGMAQEEPLTFTYVGINPANYPFVEGTNYISEYLKETMNIEPYWLSVDCMDQTAYNLFWAGGGYADVWQTSGSNITDRIEDGIARSFPIEWIKEYAPNLWELCASGAGSEEALTKMLTYEDGNCYGIPTYNFGWEDNWVICINQEWLQNLGLEKPVTMEDWEKMLHEMTYGDPDGNGVDDTYGIAGDYVGTYPFAAYYGTSPNVAWFVDENNQVYLNATTEEYKQYLAKMREFYAAGYMDPEFITDTRAEFRSKFTSNRVGTYIDAASNLVWSVVGPYEVKDENGNSTGEWTNKMVCTNVIQNPAGEMVGSGGFTRVGDGYTIQFGEDTSDEVVIAVIKMMNENMLSVNPDFFWTMFYGEKGVHWDYQTLENGTEIVANLVEMTSELRAEVGFQGFQACQTFDQNIPGATSRYIGCEDFLAELAGAAGSVGKVYTNKNYPFTDLSDMTSDKASAISTAVSLFKTQIITGEKNLDTDWDAFQAELMDAGLAEVLAEYQAQVNG